MVRWPRSHTGGRRPGPGLLCLLTDWSPMALSRVASGKSAVSGLPRSTSIKTVRGPPARIRSQHGCAAVGEPPGREPTLGLASTCPRHVPESSLTRPNAPQQPTPVLQVGARIAQNDEDENDLVMRRSGVRLPEAAPTKTAGQGLPFAAGIRVLDSTTAPGRSFRGSPTSWDRAGPRSATVRDLHR